LPRAIFLKAIAAGESPAAGGTLMDHRGLPNQPAVLSLGQKKIVLKWVPRDMSDLPTNIPGISAFDQGGVKTLTFISRVEFPSRFRRCGNQLHW
jgi:hypothetical protein